MDLKTGLHTRQTQQLILNQRLQQAIKLLQLNQFELLNELQNEILENCTLEEGGLSPSEEGVQEAMEREAKGEAAATDLSEQQNGAGEGESDLARLLREDERTDYGPRTSAGMDDLPPIESTLAATTSLTEHLMEQLRLESCTDGEMAAATLIIHNLDARGYLESSLEELFAGEPIDWDDVEGGLMIVQGLDPIGCGAASLEECLILQAKAKYPEDPFFPRILKHHLSDLEKRNYAGVARALGIDAEDAAEYHKMLRQFDPFPGRNFSDEAPQFITPDVHVFKVGDQWEVQLNESGLPKLKISRHVREVAQGKDATREEKDYIKKNLSGAEFLLKSLYKRQDTIRKVMLAILDRQRDFFEFGPDHLKPLVLRDVAEDIGVVESTVSRVTSGKYVQCPQGLYELKFFFNNGVNAVSGDQVSAEAVKRRIKKLVASEDSKSPISDDQIVQLLKRENIDIARRTVAKYREALGILPSSKRRALTS